MKGKRKPGTISFHELLDRTCIIAENFSENIAGHPSAGNPKIAKRIKRLESELFDLYQKLGAMHLK